MASDSDGQVVALRVMHDSFRVGSSGPKLFRRGCEVMESLPDHPNIVRYYSKGKEKGREYAVIEYIEGPCLREMMVRKDSRLDEILSDIVVELAAALEHLHDNGFMHLDIKPENLIVSRSGASFLCDFDTAHLIPDKPAKLEKKSGTPFYMSPELMNGWKFDHRADIYAFGVAVYELLTGVKPFEGQTQKAMLANQLNQRYRIRELRNFNSNIPIMLDELIIKCLDFVPEKRPPNMTILAREIHRIMGVR
jgi:serine/threonine-protein kinase|tara:strand:- start:104 stop:853 length:750 start_codon:yes stop_codon:yes gene_type:complete